MARQYWPTLGSMASSGKDCVFETANREFMRISHSWLVLEMGFERRD